MTQCIIKSALFLFITSAGFALEPDAGVDDTLQDVQLRSLKEKKKFKNHRESVKREDSSFFGIMKEMFFSKNIREPEEHLEYSPIDPDALFKGYDNGLRVTWLGHSSFIVELDGLRIVFDPVLSNNASPIPWLIPVKRFQENAPISMTDLPNIDVAIISHDHFDHLDKKTIKAIHGKVSRFMVPQKVDEHLIKWGVPAEKITILDWSESIIIKQHTITALPAQHSSGRGILGRNQTLWASWAIAGPHHKLYFSGDTGYHHTFKRIGEMYGPFDMVFLDSGQYGANWPDMHMFPEEAVQAHLDLKGKVYVPIHWGAFNLSTHNWFDPIESGLC